MKAIIVDDEQDGIRTLQKMLEQHCPGVEVVATSSGADMAKQQILHLNPDLVFLDIQMPGKSGLELLAGFASRQFEVVFVTAYNEYILQALQYSAADYLLKPVDEDRLMEAVGRVRQRMQWERKDLINETLLHNISMAGMPSEMRLCLPTARGFMVMRLDEIIYCEAERSYTVFHLQNGRTITVSKPLLEYDQLLSDTSFMRIHKSFLINLNHVKEYHRGEGGQVVMSNNAELEVSRRKKDQFLMKIRQAFRY